MTVQEEAAMPVSLRDHHFFKVAMIESKTKHDIAAFQRLGHSLVRIHHCPECNIWTDTLYQRPCRECWSKHYEC